MPTLAILALWLASARRVPQSAEHIGLGYLLDVLITGKRVTVEATAEEYLEMVSVGQEPSFHALNQEMSVVVRGIIRLVPAIAHPQMKPRSGTLRDRAFAIYQQYGESPLVARSQRDTKLVKCALPTATGDDLRHAPNQACLGKKGAKTLAASRAQLPTIAASFDIDPDGHQRFPPISPELQSSPKRYFSSQWESSSLSSRFIFV